MICSNGEDEFIIEKPRWAAELSNGLVAYQDDGRGNPPSAWLRLKDYLQENKINISNFFLQFRSHVEHPFKQTFPAYFFSKKIAGFSIGGSQESILIGGMVKPKIFLVQEWLVPELLLVNTEYRGIALDDERVIKNS